MDASMVTGMVLRVQPVGERDRIVWLLTAELGKISAFARGARRQDSPLLGVCQPFIFGTFRLFEGRTSYTIQSAEVTNSFMAVRDDLEAACYGMYFCEAADYFTRENLPSTDVLKLLYQSMRALEAPSLKNRLVRRVFELRLMLCAGEAPELSCCVAGGETEGLTGFSSSAGGAVCSQHGTAGHGILPLSADTRYTMQTVLSKPVEKLYTFTVNDTVLTEFERIMDDYYRVRVGRKFKSLELLNVPGFTDSPGEG